MTCCKIIKYLKRLPVFRSSTMFSGRLIVFTPPRVGLLEWRRGLLLYLLDVGVAWVFTQSLLAALGAGVGPTWPA